MSVIKYLQKSLTVLKFSNESSLFSFFASAVNSFSASAEFSWVILFSIFLILVSLFMGVVSFVVDKKRAVRYLFTLFASVGIMMAAIYAPNIAEMIVDYM